MASYISSYFGSGSNSNPNYGQYQPQYQQYQQGPAQTQTGSTWTSTFSSRVGALRKALTRGSEEDDDDNEDCSHVSNVLRAYYTEKGRPYPEWLPPDPRKPVVAPVPQAQFGQYANYPAQGGMTHSRANSQGRGGLSDLWDSGPAQPPQQTQSLRASRPTPQALRPFDSSSRMSGSDSNQPPARPLPSQRAGSYQNVLPAPTPPPSGNPRDRLRARLQGGGSGRSSPANTSQGSYSSDQQYGGGGPTMSASQPWTNDGNSYGPSADRDKFSGYGNPSYQQRSGGYR